MHTPATAFVLLTDFGLADPYAGQMRAALFARAPHVPILDLSHEVPPFAVSAGAFFLAASYRQFPPGSIFICVVDPGVGSSRNLLCIDSGRHILLGPDNGLLYMAYDDMLHDALPNVYALPEVNLAANTFHGRDILAPAAAALANGASPAAIGTPYTEALARPGWVAPRVTPAHIDITVLHIDRFGNCICNLPADISPPPAAPLLLEIPGGPAHPLVPATHYTALPEKAVGLIPGSQGFYELARNGASAAKSLALSVGQRCRIIRGVP